MKRHPALIPLSHDHHHALVQARRLRHAAKGETAERRDGAAAFLEFFEAETRRHFRDEEEWLFPLLVGGDEATTGLLARTLLEHQRVHALVAQIARQLSAADVSAASMQELGQLLEEHVRFEERTLFPLIERVAGEDDLRRLGEAEDRDVPIALLSTEATGVLWGTATEDLNATLLAWPPGAGPAEHVNSERDVLLVVLSGSALVVVDGTRHEVHGGHALAIEKGCTRQITAGPDGVRYLTVHTRRPPLQISPLPPQ